MSNEKFNFRKEFDALPYHNRNKAKKEIMAALSIKSEMGFNYRMNGVNNSSIAEQEVIKKIIIDNREVQISLNF